MGRLRLPKKGTKPMFIHDSHCITSDRDREPAIWNHIDANRKVIHGGIQRVGFSMEFNDFFAESSLKWSDTFDEQSIEICINLQGTARIRNGLKTFTLKDNQCAIYTVAKNRPIVTRQAGEQHRFYTLKLSLGWLQGCLQSNIEQVTPQIRRFLALPHQARPYVACFPLPLPLLSMRTQFLEPPVPESGQDMWYYGKIYEVLAHTIYTPKATISSSEKRNSDRVERVRTLIESNIATPPSLEAIAQEVGCSMFHLSRIFKQCTGINISDYQRSVSMSAAVDYLQEGKSVNETAGAVGYRSASAFISVFHKVYQMTPTQWLALKREQEGAEAS